MTPIVILDTGGTINGILGEKDTPPEQSLVIEHLRKNAERYQVRLADSRQIVMKDSRALTVGDRDALVAAIKACPNHRILIPHGTFTMAETGEYLEARLGEELTQRCIVLVGARKPLSDPHTDALSRIDFALASLKKGSPGVWIAMADTLWSPATVRKDPNSGEFVARDA
ncbi:MAG: asparaginase domain-containing protein [Pseudomonadota bacterium]